MKENVLFEKFQEEYNLKISIFKTTMKDLRNHEMMGEEMQLHGSEGEFSVFEALPMQKFNVIGKSIKGIKNMKANYHPNKKILSVLIEPEKFVPYSLKTEEINESLSVREDIDKKLYIITFKIDEQ